MAYRLTVTNPIDRGVNLFLCCMQSEKHFLSHGTKLLKTDGGWQVCFNITWLTRKLLVE